MQNRISPLNLSGLRLTVERECANPQNEDPATKRKRLRDRVEVITRYMCVCCDEAMKDVGIQFEFATVSDGRLLAQTMWNELLAATPTPPAQAAADANGSA